MIAIQCSRLFDGETFSAGAATVLIEENRIVAVESGFPTLGEQWEVVRYSDATVLPGLIDTHVHLVGDSRPGALDRVPGLSDDEIDRVISEGLERQLAAGVTTVRDLGDRRYAVVDRRDRQRTGNRATTEPTILASGPPLTKPAGHCYYLGGVVDGPDAISAAIRERAERKVDVVKVMASGGMSTPGTDVMRTQFTTDEMMMIVAQAHAAGMLVTAHAHGLPAVEQCVAASVDCIEHCTCLTDKGFELSDELIDDIATNGIAVSGVIPPPKLDFNQAPPAVREMAAKMGVSPSTDPRAAGRHDAPNASTGGANRHRDRLGTESMVSARQLAHRVLATRRIRLQPSRSSRGRHLPRRQNLRCWRPERIPPQRIRRRPHRRRWRPDQPADRPPDHPVNPAGRKGPISGS